jgi:hypothetical protein
MAGRLTVSTLNNDTGVLATQNGMTGIAKAWVYFNGGNGNTAGVINGSFNVSSITVIGAGQYTVNFTTAMPNANYSAVATSSNAPGSVYANLGNSAPTSSSYAIWTIQSGSVANPTFICSAVFA